ncbi:MAG: hypothetical protein EXS15_00830 [Phycisphaerales bacterium]|nr:hypothetical protein [Phycisphaerales bacterium]
MRKTLPYCAHLSVGLALLASPSSSVAQVTARGGNSITEHFGFDGVDAIKVDKGGGPLTVADLDSDGKRDLIAINNRNSRIDLLYQKVGAKPTDDVPPTSSVNEIPQHWRFRRVEVPVSEAVGAVLPWDFDGDKRVDLIYSAESGKIVFLRQSAPGVFEVVRKHTVKNLNPSRDAFMLINLLGDDKPELVGIANGRIQVWPFTGSDLGTPIELSAGNGNIVATIAGDLEGDGTNDLIGIMPDDAAPIRAWFGSKKDGTAALGPQTRFEMPPLRDADIVPISGLKGSALAVVEKPSKRVALLKFAKEAITEGGDREASLQTWAFTDTANRKRDTAVADINGDGLQDLVATNTEANALSIFTQVPGRGFVSMQNSPAYTDLDFVVAGDIDGDGRAEVFVSSEKEGVVGRTTFAKDGLEFPQTMPMSGGNVPTALGLVHIDGRNLVAVIGKDGRNYSIELQPADGSLTGKVSIPLGALSRAPDTILALDADQDSLTDLLLFTPDKPMTMLRQEARVAVDGETLGAKEDKDAVKPDANVTFKILESKDMAQFGLAQAANAQNTAIADIDGDGKHELLVADRNFVRALRFDSKLDSKLDSKMGSIAGWQVVEQINSPRGDTKFSSITMQGDRIAAGDRENGRVVIFARDTAAKTWKQVDEFDVKGFKFNSLAAGPFTGGKDQGLLLIGDEGFGVMRFSGSREKLEELSSWRNDDIGRVPHELGVGDLNQDGMTDLVVLDAGKQMLDVLGVSAANILLPAVSFRVFESRLFSGGEPREFEPSQAMIDDVTGDGADDLILMCHDRILLYPQMTETSSAQSAEKK